PRRTGTARANEEARNRQAAGMARAVFARGAALAFAAGIVLNLVPGIVPIVAVKDIAGLDAGAAESLALLTLFYAIMFAFVEVPLLGYLFAPERTTVAVRRFNMWLTDNAGRLATTALAVAGVYFVIRGLVSALA